MAWFVLNSQWNVVSIRTYSWRILAGVTAQTLSYSWSILGGVVQALAYSWYVAKALAYSWNIFNPAISVLTYSWRILESVSMSRPSFISRSSGRKKIFSQRDTIDPNNEVRRGKFWGTR
jgi:TM2 domain-containing membrane protein YozV